MLTSLPPWPALVQAMSRPILYPLARAVARLVTGVYFRRIEVVGADRVPAHGPVILAANHPQSITDALVLGLATRRVVHYVAHSGLFAPWAKRWVLRGGGVIPIHRPTDVSDARTRNEQSFRACCDVLAAGGCIGIFPEGTSAQERRVQRFKTGTVRIALQAEQEHDFGLGVTIVPVALSFQSASHFRSRVLVTFGKPIAVSQWRQDFERDAEATVVELTGLLQERIRRNVVHIERDELDDFVRRVDRVVRSELLQREGLDVPGRSRFEREQTLSREIASAAGHLYESRPDLIGSLDGMLTEYEEHLQRLRLPDRIVREESATFRGEAIRLILFVVLGLPVAVWGLVWNYAPYRLTGVSAGRLTDDRTKVHWVQLGIGSALFLAFYSLWAGLALLTFSTPVALAILASMPPAGMFARWFATRLSRRQRHLRWAYLRSTRRLVVQRVLELRSSILATVDEAVEDHLARLQTRREEGTP